MNQIINSKIQLRNDVSTNWNTINPVLLKGEFGLEIDTSKFKFGDGVTNWNSLAYVVTGGDSELPDITTAGTYTKVTVNAKGLVTTGANITAEDITGLLNTDGKINNSFIPSLAITNVFTCTDEATMLALETAETGDICIRTDVSESFILTGTDKTVLSSWTELLTGTDTVLSVNGKTGVVSLSTSDIAEGSNLYYTEARATANFTSHSVRDLNDGEKVITTDDTIILNGGNA